MFVNVFLFFVVGRRVSNQGLIQFPCNGDHRFFYIHIISHDSPPVPSLRDQEETPAPPRPATTTQRPVLMSRIRTGPALFGAVQGLELGQDTCAVQYTGWTEEEVMLGAASDGQAGRWQGGCEGKLRQACPKP